MRTSWALVIGGVVGMATVGCSDPSLAFDLRYGDPDPRPELASLTLAVVSLPDHDDGTPVTCGEVRFGRINPAVLEGGRRAEAVIPTGDGVVSTAAIAGVPRLGDKLVLLTGRDASGRRIVGGCTAVGDITGDQTITVDAEVAPRLRLLGLNAPTDPTAPPRDFLLGAYQPWKQDGDFVVLAGAEVQVDARDRSGDRERFAACPGPSGPCAQRGPGLMVVPITAANAVVGQTLQPGPVELTVRAPWVEEPLLVRAFAPLPRLGMSQKLAPAATPRAINQVSPSWSALSGGGLRAAALHVTGGATPLRRIVLIDSPNGALRRRELAVPEPIATLVTWQPATGLDELWTLTGSGWQRIGFDQGLLSPGVAPLAGPATELIMVAPCEDDGALRGLMVRLGDEAYQAFDEPKVPTVGAGELSAIVARVNALLPGRVVAAECLSYPDGVHRTVFVRRDDGTTEMVRGGAAKVSPIVAGFVGYEDDDGAGDKTWRLAGSTLEVTGPRLQSYTLTAATELVEDDGRLDGELTNLPRTTQLGAIEGATVVITTHEIVDESRLQLTFPSGDERPPLTGVSPAIRGLQPRALLSVVPLPGGGTRPVVALATSETLELFSLVPVEAAQ
jgi:hypothetical protein